MSATPKQSPLGVNVLASLLQNTGITINTSVTGYVGSSTSLAGYTPGTLVSSTPLSALTTAINLAYTKLGADVTATTFNNLLNLGSGTIPALANARPATYTRTIAVTETTTITNLITCTNTENLELNSIVMFSGVGFGGLAPNTIYYVKTIDSPSTFTVSLSSGGPVVGLGNATGALVLINFGLYQWGFIGSLAYQAYKELNYTSGSTWYTDFLASFMDAHGFIEMLNPVITTVNNSSTFLENIYSNMNDLISGDVAGVNLATTLFGQDLIALGRALDLSSISTFGLPSNLLKTIQENNAITRALTLAVLASGITTSEYSTILADPDNTTVEQQRKLYGAFCIILGRDLQDVTTPLNCKTAGLTSLADLLNPKKMFPLSYESMTVPVYNTVTLPTNSKTYYPVYVNGEINPALLEKGITNAVGTIIPSEMPVPVAVRARGGMTTNRESLNPSTSTTVSSDIASGSSSGAINGNMDEYVNALELSRNKFQ